MADIATVSAILSSVKTATEIAKLIKDSDSNLQAAEVKLNMAELISNLADVKLELADLQTELRSKDVEIIELKEQLNTKLSLVYDSVSEVYWKEGDNAPYCPSCYEADGKLIHLSARETVGIAPNQVHSPHHYCRVCRKSFFNTPKERI
ncbi:hypothetical protein [Vibrio diabolicus]|uniref:hypothetical protein n=1 Tax=Vibrio diabolicus TaxID=50719 RepID=UPI00215DF8DA|nr:hypothetical protein [Vibrio diabolicus]MCS0446874.1 hypothetical protein [Vibrio diabolicus]